MILTRIRIENNSVTLRSPMRAGIHAGLHVGLDRRGVSGWNQVLANEITVAEGVELKTFGAYI